MIQFNLGTILKHKLERGGTPGFRFFPWDAHHFVRIDLRIRVLGPKLTQPPKKKSEKDLPDMQHTANIHPPKTWSNNNRPNTQPRPLHNPSPLAFYPFHLR